VAEAATAAEAEVEAEAEEEADEEETEAAAAAAERATGAPIALSHRVLTPLIMFRLGTSCERRR
jgi:hypothetical protein